MNKISGGKTITSGYANRHWNGETKFHAGIDFRGAEGTDIVSANTGKVSFITFEENREWGRGHCIIIESSNDKVYGKTTKIRTIYMHMKSKPSVDLGNSVTKGETKIGEVGNTGSSDGPHLHFGVISDGSDGGSLTHSRTLNPFWFYTNITFDCVY